MKSDQNINITITYKTLVQVFFTVVLMWLLFRFVSLAFWPIQMVIISAFLAIGLNPIVSRIAGLLRRQKRVLATAVAYLIVMSIILSVLAFVIPTIYEQGHNSVANLPRSVEDLDRQDTTLVHFINDRGLHGAYTNLITSIQDYFSNSTQTAITTVSRVGGAVVSMIAVLVMTFMMLVEGPAWINRLWNMQHGGDIIRRKRMLKKMYRMITGYVNGQLVVAAIASTLTFVVLFTASKIFDVQINALALALVVAIFNMIPLIGSTISAIIVVLVCLFVSGPLALFMAIFFLLYQQIENATLQPIIQSKYNELTPLTVFIAALFGVTAGGFIGALIAIPVAGCLRIYLLEYHGHRLRSNLVKESNTIP